MKIILTIILLSIISINTNAQETKTYHDNGQLKEVGSFDKDRQKIGEWKAYYGNGNLESKVIFENDVPKGMIYTYFKNGNPKEIMYVIDDTTQGVWKEFYENGIIKLSGNYNSDSQKIGEWSEFNKNGMLLGKTTYDSGQAINLLIIDYDAQNHIVKKWYKEWIYTENKKVMKNITLEKFYQSGQLKETMTAENGKIGICKCYYKSGELEMAGKCSDIGDRVGEWKYYHKNEQLKKVVSFDENGDVLKRKHYGGNTGSGKVYKIEMHNNEKGEVTTIKYSRKGKISQTEVYNMNNDIKHTRLFDEDGKIYVSIIYGENIYGEKYSIVKKYNKNEDLTFFSKLYKENGKHKQKRYDKNNKITTQLEMSKNTFKVGDPISVNFFVKNKTATVFEFCYWQTPLEKEFTANCFEIIHEGEILEYIGRQIKRKPPTKEDNNILKPNETSTQSININEGYVLTKPGAYSIRFLGRILNGLPDSEPIHFIVNP